MLRRFLATWKVDQSRSRLIFCFLALPSSVLASCSYPADRSQLRALLYPTVWRARARAGTSIGKTRVGERAMRWRECRQNQNKQLSDLSTVSFEVLENWAQTQPDTIQIYVHFKIAGIFVTLSPHVFSSVRIYLSSKMLAYLPPLCKVHVWDNSGSSPKLI